jgi:hypothetical protein
MVSRAYRKCEDILKQLISEYGPTAKIGYPLVQKAIKTTVGHDPRTIKNYLRSLVEFNMIVPQRHSLENMLQDIQEEKLHFFTLNWKKVADYKQLTFSEVIDEK